MAFLRPLVLDYFAPRDGYVSGTYPRVFYYGFGWFLQYAAILIFAHHFFLFYIEVFRLSDFFLLSAGLSSAASLHCSWW
jgi:hypothetical protein